MGGLITQCNSGIVSCECALGWHIRIGLHPVVWWAEGNCSSSLFTSGSFLGETGNTADVAANGFRKAGLFPCNPNIFRSYDFVFWTNQKRLVRAHHITQTEGPDQLRDSGPQQQQESPSRLTSARAHCRGAACSEEVSHWICPTHDWFPTQKIITGVVEKGAQTQATREGNNSLETRSFKETSPPSQDKG
jgi:hypothetical protein